MIGQINLGTPAGECMKSIASRPDVKTIVEIGTWNGAGSTKCIHAGMSAEDTLYSLECSRPMYESAVRLWKDKENVHLIFGRIIEEQEMDITNLSREETVWHTNDVAAMRECPNVINDLPKSIDLLVLDGGEFSTLAEYNKLVNRSTYIFLDDTVCRKNRQVRRTLMQSTAFETLEDSPNDRHGWSLFRRRLNTDQ